MLKEVIQGNTFNRNIVKSIIVGFFLSLIFSIDIRSLNTKTFAVVNVFPLYSFAQWIQVLGISFFVYRASVKCSTDSSYDSTLLKGIALLFGVLNTMGIFMYYNDALPRNTREMVAFTLFFLGCSYIFLLVSRCFCRSIELCECEKKQPYISKVSGRSVFWWSFIVIILCWLPWLVMYYPASMEWDVYHPIRQFLGQASPDNHHPWFYSCVVGSFYKLGLYFNNKNLGIFIYIVLRAFVMIGIYAKCVKLITSMGCRRWMSLLALVFFALTPVWGAYAKHAFKDAIAAALFCWFVLSMIEWIYCMKQGRLSNAISLEVGVSSLMMSLFRHNCVYVAIPVLCILTVVSVKNKVPKKMIFCLLSGLILFSMWHFGALRAMHVGSGSSREALSIPLQQTARTVKYHKRLITQEEKAAINGVLDYNRLGKDYTPLLSDPVKDRWHGSSNDRKRYFVTWAKMFFKYPKTYIEAAVSQSYGYYAFTKDQKPGAGNSNCGMTIFNWVKDNRFPVAFTCDYIQGFEKGRKVLAEWADIWHRLPVLNVTDTKCVYFWFVVLLGYILLMRREFVKLIPVSAVLLMAFTCMASPVNDCFRYFVPVAAATPALFILIGKGY